jgi:hypothetical protein
MLQKLLRDHYMIKDVKTKIPTSNKTNKKNHKILDIHDNIHMIISFGNGLTIRILL